MKVSLSQLSMILATLATEIQNLMMMMKRDLGFNHDDICRKREIIPGFHLYITKINSKHQTSFLLSLKVDLMLLLAIY